MSEEYLEQKKKAFFDLSLDMLCIAGLDGRFKVLNPAWERVLGYASEELLAGPFIDFVHPDDHERTLRETAMLGEEGYNSINFENRYICKDGSTVHLQWASTMDVEEGLIYAVARDVTSLRRSEARVRALNEELFRIVQERTEKLNFAGSDLGRLARLASGDLRSTLRALTSNLDALVRKVKPDLDVEGRELLRRSTFGAREVRSVIGHLIDYSTLEEPTFEPVDFAGVVKRVCAELRPILDANDAVVGGQDLPTVSGERAQLEALVRLLVEHALTFRSTSRSPLMTFSSEARGESLHIEFVHNGVGFEPAELERAFDFASRVRRADGKVRSAMVLSVCRRIVELHRGAIALRRDDPSGRSIQITLPKG